MRHANATDFMRMVGTRYFYCEFIKRTDGTLRKGVFQLSVRQWKALDGSTQTHNGSGMAYDPAEYGLIPVFEVSKRHWRMLNLRGIIAMHSGNDYFINLTTNSNSIPCCLKTD